MKSTCPVAARVSPMTTASSTVWPPGISHAPLMRTPTTKSGPHDARTASTISTTSRTRFSTEPPYWSVRLLNAGVSHSPKRCGWAAWISTPSTPAARLLRAQRTNPATNAAMSSASIAFGISPRAPPIADGVALGAHTGSHGSGPLDWRSGPFWASCTKTLRRRCDSGRRCAGPHRLVGVGRRPIRAGLRMHLGLADHDEAEAALGPFLVVRRRPLPEHRPLVEAGRVEFHQLGVVRRHEQPVRKRDRTDLGAGGRCSGTSVMPTPRHGNDWAPAGRHGRRDP